MAFFFPQSSVCVRGWFLGAFERTFPRSRDRPWQIVLLVYPHSELPLCGRTGLTHSSWVEEEIFVGISDDQGRLALFLKNKV